MYVTRARGGAYSPTPPLLEGRRRVRRVYAPLYVGEPASGYPSVPRAHSIEIPRTTHARNSSSSNRGSKRGEEAEGREREIEAKASQAPLSCRGTRRPAPCQARRRSRLARRATRVRAVWVPIVPLPSLKHTIIYNTQRHTIFIIICILEQKHAVRILYLTMPHRRTFVLYYYLHIKGTLVSEQYRTDARTSDKAVSRPVHVATMRVEYSARRDATRRRGFMACAREPR